MAKTFSAFLHRADEGTLCGLLVESSILLAASCSNPAVVLKDTPTAYKVDIDAIGAKVKQEFAVKEKAKTTAQPTARAAKKAA
jgi:ParB family chromosome partitioning protein